MHLRGIAVCDPSPKGYHHNPDISLSHHNSPCPQHKISTFYSTQLRVHFCNPILLHAYAYRLCRWHSSADKSFFRDLRFVNSEIHRCRVQLGSYSDLHHGFAQFFPRIQTSDHFYCLVCKRCPASCRLVHFRRLLVHQQHYCHSGIRMYHQI